MNAFKEQYDCQIEDFTVNEKYVEYKERQTSVWYKAVPVGRNTLAKQMKTIASIATFDRKFTNSSGRKTVVQSLREDFHLLAISELTGHANPDSISSYIHNPLEKELRMSNKLALFSSSTTITVTAANASSGPRTEALREVSVNSPTLPSITQQQWITAVMVQCIFPSTCSSMLIPMIQAMAVACCEFLQMKGSKFLDF